MVYIFGLTEFESCNETLSNVNFKFKFKTGIDPRRFQSRTSTPLHVKVAFFLQPFADAKFNVKISPWIQNSIYGSVPRYILYFFTSCS